MKTPVCAGIGMFTELLLPAEAAGEDVVALAAAVEEPEAAVLLLAPPPTELPAVKLAELAAALDPEAPVAVPVGVAGLATETPSKPSPLMPTSASSSGPLLVME